MDFLHNKLLTAAATDGISQMMRYGGVGAAVGGAYGAFDDTGTMMQGAFKGATLGAGGAAGLKYFGNRYATGFNMAAERFVQEADPALHAFMAPGSHLTSSANVNEVFNRGLNVQDSGRQLASKFNSRFIGIGKEANFSDNIDTSAASKLLSDFNKKAAGLNKPGTSPGADKYSMNQFALGMVNTTGERDKTIGSIYNSGADYKAFWDSLNP